MARVVKDPELRRLELIETAQSLFYSQGYENTSIQNIVDAIGIAKGTFYHYFHSKVDLLGQLAEWQTDNILKSIEKQIEKLNGNAIEKFRALISSILSWKTENRKMMKTYIEVMYMEENIPLRIKVNQIYVEKVNPIFTKIIKQGVKEGVFKVKSVDEISEIFLSMLLAMSDRLAPLTLASFKEKKYIPVLFNKVKAFENSMERILGMKDGELKIYDYKALEIFFKGGP